MPNGAPSTGEETWYTLDNRRLVCLQRMASSVWPRIACCPVVVLDELPKQSTARKFRSLDYGMSVRIGPRWTPDGEENYAAPIWSWMEYTRGMQILEHVQMRALGLVQ